MYLLLRTSKTREFFFFTLIEKITVMYFISPGAKTNKAKNSEPKSNLDVLKKNEDLEKKDEEKEKPEDEKEKDKEGEDDEEAEEPEEYDEDEHEEENDVSSHFEDGDDFGVVSDDNMVEAT
ncbi:LOW QUALITY PROTEIN: DNA-directed RNA polymerase III subunit RPC7 [Geothlypis trichas]